MTILHSERLGYARFCLIPREELCFRDSLSSIIVSLTNFHGILILKTHVLPAQQRCFTYSVVCTETEVSNWGLKFIMLFQVDGCGIDAMSQVFLDLGYKVRDELRFPAKKLRALWFSPPDHLLDMDGSEADGPLPRIFISEIIVNQLSSETQVKGYP